MIRLLQRSGERWESKNVETDFPLAGAFLPALAVEAVRAFNFSLVTMLYYTLT
jgi:hypothetical protein